jgi:hypothetical protein
MTVFDDIEALDKAYGRVRMGEIMPGMTDDDIKALYPDEDQEFLTRMFAKRDRPTKIWSERAARQDVMKLKLIALSEKWQRIVANKFRSADQETGEMERRFIEHGGVCYFNCFTELNALVQSWDSTPDLKSQIFEQDTE